MATKASKRRATPRSYFHAGRQPSILFFQNQRSFIGALSDVSLEGLGIVLEGSVIPDISMPVDVIYIGKAEDAFKMESMRLATIRRDYSTDRTHIGIQVESESQIERLQQIVTIVAEGPRVLEAGAFTERKLPFVRGKEHYSGPAIEDRLNWIRNATHAPLKNLPRSNLNPYSLMGNIENYVGSVEIPVGVTSPVLINGTYAKGHISVPIATSEGALVSSISRGAYAISLAGGAITRVFRQTMVRSPLFFCETIDGALNLERWINNHFHLLSQKVQSMSSVAKLQLVKTFIFSSSVHVQFYYSTGDAAGQNMTTVCTWACCELIQSSVQDDRSIQYEFYSIEGNMSGDKKSNIQNFIMGRGIGVMAEVTLPEKILRRILRVDSEKLLRVIASAESGCLMIGMTNGPNVNFSNVIAGIFAATGQDLACVHESSAGFIKIRGYKGQIVATAYLPSLVIGTVGGGTMLPAQHDCLDMLGCLGSGKAFRFAEIIAATCLALDLSTVSATTTNEFVKAHEKLGRNRPESFSRSQIDAKFFQSMIGSKAGKITGCEPRQLTSNQSIITKLFDKTRSGVSGIYRYTLSINDPENGARELPVVLKIKNVDTDIIEFGVALIRLLGEEQLADRLAASAGVLGFSESHLREIEVYASTDPIMRQYSPQILGLIADEERQLYAILMEDLSDLDYYSSVSEGHSWDTKDIASTLEQLTHLQSRYWAGANLNLKTVSGFQVPELVEARAALWQLTEFNHDRRADLISPDLFGRLRRFFDQFEANLVRMKNYHQTLSHNDFNPRNLCLRQGKLVVYDWELCKIQNPQYDCAEFLLYTLKQASDSEIRTMVDDYRKSLEVATGQELDSVEFNSILALNVLLFVTLRLNLYLLASGLLDFAFLPDVYDNASRLVQLFDPVS
ncbi:MAG: phosphotransferase [Spirochaetia bacterium]|nr:phosphotransferase [Spirochaetia bacterium]